VEEVEGNLYGIQGEIMNRDTRKTVRGTLFYSLSAFIGGTVAMVFGLDPNTGVLIGAVVMGLMEKGYRLARSRWSELSALDPVLDSPLDLTK
jgi:Zn-dependent protease with chaperone function